MDIRIENLCKAFGELRVLENYSCVIKEHDITCMMGESGSGKTTLMNILLGLEQADGGICEGVPCGHLGAVFQEDRLCENLSALANIKLVCKRKTEESLIRQALLALHLEDAFGKPVRELSGGMRRRVAILRALLAESRMIVMDEPLKGLDEHTRLQTLEYIRKHRDGRTLLWITHDKRDVADLKAKTCIRIPSSGKSDQ